MSEEKKTTTLYLRRDILARCRELNINISETVNQILRIVLDRPGIHDEEIMLAILQTQRQKVQRQIDEWQSSIGQAKLQLDAFDQKIERQKEIVDEIHRSDAIAQNIRLLNQKIQDAEFDEQKIRSECQDVLTELRKLKVPIDKAEWLTKQIERVKRISVT